MVVMRCGLKVGGAHSTLPETGLFTDVEKYMRDFSSFGVGEHGEVVSCHSTTHSQSNIMKRRSLFTAILLTGFASLFSAQAAEETPKPKAKPYPLETCIVSGEKLGSMGKPMVFEYKDQEVKLCCKSCKSKFDKDADALLKKIQETPKKS